MMPDNNMIYITKRQASIVSAVLVVLGLLSFVLGYFWGKKSVIDDFGQKIVQDSAQDQVDYLLTMQSFAEKTKQDIERSGSSAEKIEHNLGDEKITFEHKPEEEVNVETQKTDSKEIEASSLKDESEKRYYAVLIGFNTKNAAINFVNRLRKQKINVDIKARKSKSASGRVTKTWYQVVTKYYPSKAELQKVIDRIKRLEKIKSDIKIV